MDWKRDVVEAEYGMDSHHKLNEFLIPFLGCQLDEEAVWDKV